MRRALFPAAALAVTLLVAAAPGAQKSPPVVPTSRPAAAHPAVHTVLHEADVAWTDAPPNLPPGAKIAVLDGDPGKSGLYTMRLKIPNGYKVAPHWHPMAEHLTVLTGIFHVATGDKFDSSKGTGLKAGEYAVMPAKMHHYAWCEGETVVQVHGTGPFKLIYVDPKDDPSGGAKK